MKVLIVPKGPNPYQELLYSELRRMQPNDTFSYLKTSRKRFAFYPIIFLIKRFQGYQILHIHWFVFSINSNWRMVKYVSYLYTVTCIFMPKLLGYRIVWTVHEVIPYNACTSNDVSVAKILSRISDAKIVHSKSTISQMRVMGLSTRNTILIPHGNYKNAYSDNLSASESRKRLKIKSHEMVILFFGLIRPYKGVDQLLDSFGNLKAKFPDLHLIIAGKSRDEKMSLQIQQVAKNGNVIFVNDYIEDTEVGKFFKAADVVCLPFKTTTTSGSALLALTFGRALVAPKVGSLVDLPSSVGYFYDPADSTALEKNIEKAIKNRQEVRIMSRNAKRYANSLSWSSIAEKTLQLYSSVLKPHVPRRYRDEND